MKSTAPQMVAVSGPLVTKQKKVRNIKIKKGIKLLIFSDFLIYFGVGLTSPILAVFIKDGLNSTIAMAGLAATFFLIIRSVSQLVFSRIFNPEDRIKMILGGAVLIVLTPFIYAFSTNIQTLFLAQVIHGLGAGLAAPAWMSLFILNVNKKTAGFEWALYSTIIGIGMGLAAYLGGGLVGIWGFKPVFLISGLLAILGMLVLFKVTKEKMK
ncbi:MAG: MFS transporter [Nanoarchaeota archaeon]|nr:MFS transporter [Nanoarchaeota archaeon]